MGVGLMWLAKICPIIPKQNIHNLYVLTANKYNTYQIFSTQKCSFLSLRPQKKMYKFVEDICKIYVSLSLLGNFLCQFTKILGEI
jgi:hypothetical protein